MNFVTQFVDSEGKILEQQIHLSSSVTVKDLNLLLNDQLKNEEYVPYSFYVNDEMIVESIGTLQQELSSEKVLNILYKPESLKRIRPVARCTATLPGHNNIILCMEFSPDCKELATGDGGGTVIFWDLLIQSHKQSLETKTSEKCWLQCIKWYQDSKILATAGTDGYISIIVKQDDGNFAIRNQFQPTRVPIYGLEWEPIHLSNSTYPRIVFSDDIGNIGICCSSSGNRLFSLSHKPNSKVMCIAFDGKGNLYSGSHDRQIKAWNPNTGSELACYEGKCEWKTMSINSYLVLRSGGFDLGKLVHPDMKVAAKQRYEEFLKNTPHEYIAASGNDYNNTSSNPIYLLKFTGKEFQLISRLTGHTKPLKHVLFSPNGYWLASGGDDRKVNIFDGKSGKYICTLGKGRNKNTGMHVNTVYRLAWSYDSRYLISASKDTTLKIWDIVQQKLVHDLPGHEDEVYAVDWSPGGRATSGGKDKKVKLWGI